MSLDAFPVAAMALMVLGAHQEVEWHLEGVGDLGSIERELVAGRDPRDHRQNAKAREGEIEIEIAERLYETRIEADFLLGLAQRGRERALVALIDLAARECDLPGMVRQFRGAHGEDDAGLGPGDHRHPPGR